MTDKAKKNKNEYIKKYKREKCVHICLQLNKKTDADIVERLSEVPNKCGYIKQLIREEIEEFEIVQGLKEETICPILSDDKVKQPCIKSPCGIERPHGEWIKHKNGDFHCTN